MAETQVPPLPASLQFPQAWEEKAPEWGGGQGLGVGTSCISLVVPEGSVCTKDNGWELKPALLLGALT